MNLKKLSIENVNLENQRVFLRVDFFKSSDEALVEPVIAKNKIMQEQIMMKIEDYEEWRTKPKPNQKIADIIPTIKYILEKGAKSIVICAHMGNPDEKLNHTHSVLPYVLELKEKLDKQVVFLPSCVGQQTEAFCKSPEKGTILFLENVFFHPEETGFYIDESGNKKPVEPPKIKEFRIGLSKLADIYVNDAFRQAHYTYSSLSGEGFKIKAAGLLFAKELTYFDKILNNPDRPFLTVIGGESFDKKLKMIDFLLEKVDEMIIGGAVCFTFLKVVKGMPIGRSPFSEEGAKHVQRLMKKAEENNVKIHLPIDFLTCDKYEDDPMDNLYVEAKEGIPQYSWGLDIGRATIIEWKAVFARAKTIFWNGTMGKYEWEEYELGSRFIDDGLYGATTERRATTVCAGIDTRAVVEIFRPISAVSHISDGHESALILMSGEKLPAVEVLNDA